MERTHDKTTHQFRIFPDGGKAGFALVQEVHRSETQVRRVIQYQHSGRFSCDDFPARRGVRIGWASLRRTRAFWATLAGMYDSP